MTCNSSHSRCDSTVGSDIATFEVIEPETDPAFDHDNCLTIYCTIGSQLSKKGPNTDPVMFESQSNRISAKSKIEDGPDDGYRQFGATSYKNNMKFCPAITVGISSRCTTMIDQFLSCFATLQENTIDWIGDAIHTMDLCGNMFVEGLIRVTGVSGVQSTDFRVHIIGHFYNSRAASLGIQSSIGGCVSATTTTTTASTTTTTSTNAAPTITTTRRQQLLLADFFSGG